MLAPFALLATAAAALALGPGAPANERAAVRDVTARVDALRLPAGARPLPEHHLLRLGRHSVEARRSWTVPRSPEGVWRWLRRHPEPGGRVFATGTATGTVWQHTVWFAFPGRRRVLVQPILDVHLRAGRDGTTVARAVASVYWQPDGLRSLVIPSTVDTVTIRPGPASAVSWEPVTLQDPAGIRAIASAVNGLEGVVPGVAHSCPAGPWRSSVLRLDFAVRGTPVATAVLPLEGCDEVHLRMTEGRLAKLDFGRPLADAIQALGVLPPEVFAPPPLPPQ